MRLSPIALPLCCISFLVYCLHIPYRAGFLCVFKCYLKDPDFGAVRTHEVLPPCPFFAASKKKKTQKDASQRHSWEAPMHQKGDWSASAPSSTWPSTVGAKLPLFGWAGGIGAEWGEHEEVSPMAVGTEQHREGWLCSGGPLGSFQASALLQGHPACQVSPRDHT